ncbi:universal stress protein [Streptomyces humicola]|uniref:universal stress protein n=1 Tax=Streptomyces humicola TaxID=2953240 RepID=UPI003557EBAD
MVFWLGRGTRFGEVTCEEAHLRRSWPWNACLPWGGGAYMTRSVVVGIDGSRDSHVAGEWAAQEAALRGLPLRLVHAALAPRPCCWPPGRCRPGLLGSEPSRRRRRRCDGGRWWRG